MGGVETTPAARLLRLLSLLQARPVWSGRELAERVGVTGRTIRRDVERLRELGYPVEATPGRDGGYRLGAGGALPPLLLDDDEATAVALALRSAAGGSVAGMEEAALAALSKLDRVLPPQLRSRVEALRDTTVNLSTGDADVDPDVLVTAAQACAAQERCRLTYRDRNGRQSERRIEPYRMVAAGRRWYLVGRDVDVATDADDGWRTFRADRIEALERMGHRFRLIDPPDAAALVSAGTTVAPYRYVARIRFATTAAVLRARVPPTVGMVEADGDDAAVLTTGADQMEYLAGHAVALAIPFEVLEPPELRAQLHRLGRALVRAHRAG
jgi:predicted DNA-binding transcriptional regulator YafY